MYKAVIFDFFDVIRTDAYKAWLALHGYKLEGDFLEAAQRQDHGEIVVDEFLAILSKLTGQPPKEIFQEMEEGAGLDRDVLGLIEQLHDTYSYKTALLSNAPSAFLRGLLHEHDLERYFDEIVISSEVGLVKPHPEIFRHALSLLRVRPDEALFIDDNPANIQGAQAVGIDGIVYMDPEQLKSELSKRGVLKAEKS